ncbi:uncharacterized protein YjdB [Humibacillus xanthopallidus]|uniref:Uncharacterized protein YjdB n=1 Tax=Humibacillus xanthopallidus TaxID=412689 RepID=A0A543HIE8_9MICO|nr:uncharacterized protein YjdB [Humibacillus xanthopallidus]
MNIRRRGLVAALASMALLFPGTAALAQTSATAAAPTVASAVEPLSNLPLISVVLADPDPTHNTITYLNASKDNVVPSTVDLVGAQDPAQNLTALSAEIKGRGNFTWTLAKKPYQLKFSSAQSVLGMAPAKTWVLLANHADTALLRNKVAFDLARELGLPYSPESRFVDLEINGQDLGNYLITEKVEVKTNRVELQDDAGLLLELDNNYGLAEDYHFYTKTSNTLFVLKDAKGGVSVPLSPTVQTAYTDIQTYLNTLESLLYAPKPDWTKISSMIDVESFLKYYFVFDLTENPEIVASSVYFYKDGPNDVLHAGPVWDFDSSEGSYAVEHLGGDPESEYVKNASVLRRRGNGWFGELFRNPQFVTAANQMYTGEVRAKIDALTSKIDGYAAEIKQSANRNFQIWPVLGKPSVFPAGNGHLVRSTWAGEVSYLRDWVAQRAGFLDGSYGETVPIVRYSTHVSTIGWQPTMSTGQIAGTIGRSLRVEAMVISHQNATVPGSIQGNAYVQSLGWQGWKGPGSTIGTTGRGLRMEGVQLRLTDQLAAKYDISYRAHVQNNGWMPWVRNGATAGLPGQGLRIEAVQVRLLPKGPNASYRSHVQGIGWMPYVTNGTSSGTTGRSLRIEALQLKVSAGPYTGDISYRGHVQSIGWQSWVGSSTFIGTTGRGLRLEALQIKLTGERAAHYAVRYRAYVQDVGWQQWVWDGATAGTTGLGKRIETVQIEVIPKTS